MKPENIHIYDPKVDMFSLDRGTCLNCGRRWSDGEWMPLAFERNSRQNSINIAKDRLCHCLAG